MRVQGMTLRDWFAGMALANEYCDSTHDSTKLAQYAYDVADEMMAVREGLSAEELECQGIDGLGQLAGADNA